MLRDRRLPVLFLVMLLASAALAPAASEADSSPSAQAVPYSATSEGVRLLSSSPAGVTFEVQVPWQQLEIVPAGDGRYVEVSLPGWSAASVAGAPRVPILVQVIGVPFGAALSVQVQAGPVHTWALETPIEPAPTQEADESLPLVSIPDAGGRSILPEPRLVLKEDPGIYGGSEAFPRVLAEVTSDAVVRQQRIAGIVAYPVECIPKARTLTVYEWLRISVAFDGAPPGRIYPPFPESPAFEELFQQSLLNYDAARAWRQAIPPTYSSSQPAGGTKGESANEGIPWAPPNPGWRVKVREDGLYQLTYAELQKAGLPVDALDPRTFGMYNLGSEVAIEVEGEEDGHFDPGDWLLFYAQTFDSKYTLDDVYWLTYGQALGQRMGARDGTPGDGAVPSHYVQASHVEKSTFYVPPIPLDEGLERWVWDYVLATASGGSSRTLTFSLGVPYPGEYPTTLSVAMWGGLVNTINPDHHVRLTLNGTLVDEVWWDGKTWLISDAEISQELLLPGKNELVVECPNDTGVGQDIVFIDWVEIEYANAFTSVGNELAFGYDLAGTWKYEVNGFSADQIAAYDVTNPARVERIEGIAVDATGPSYTARFEDEIAGSTRYWVVSTAAFRTVQAIEKDTPSNLQSTTNGVDYLVLAHAGFWDQAGALTEFRASAGLRAIRVDVQDVYDEFGYGIVGAAAIHDFVAYAYSNWQPPAPSYLLLVGDGHYDPKDYAGYGRVSHMPPYLAPVDPWTGETAGDNRYVTVAGEDSFPDLMLGRLAVDTGEEATALADKIMDYEVNPQSGDWRGKVLAVADNADSGGDFDGLSDEVLGSSLPEPYEVQKVYYGVTHPTVAGARQAILDGINAGVLIVNYVGHGAQNRWANEGLVKTTDVPALVNGDKLPIFLPMTCLEGYYILPNPPGSGYDCVAELVTRASGRGAVASWSPTGQGLANGHDSLDMGFFQAVFLDGVRSLGQATMAGKLNLWATGSNLDLLDTYLLFGDPAMEIAALDADLQATKSVEPVGSVLPGDVLTYTLTFANAGPATAHHVVLTDTLPVQLIDPQVLSTTAEVIGLIPGTAFAWEIADLPAGAEGTIVFSAQVAPLAHGRAVTNEARITAAEPDTNPADNAASVSSEVTGFKLWLPLVIRDR